jgi:hypothetical protein
MTKSITLLAVLAFASCTHPAPISYIPGFSPAPAPDGYTRFVTPTVTGLAPGDDLMFCQWIEDPQDHDRQVVDTLGFQSVGGHHVALYATSEIEPVGTSRLCTTRDMLTVSFVGAVGAEGLSSAKLPEGMAFHVPQGFALMTNTHYINSTDATIEGQSVIDVKFGDPAHPLRAAGNLAVNNDQFTIPPSVAFTSDGYCTANKQLSFFMWANHMHEWGVHARSELIRADGTKVLLAQDDTWSKDLTFNPAWVRWDIGTPLVVQPGDTFHVQCGWQNTTPDPMMFPVEMCVATGFTLEEMPQSVCEARPTL